MITNILSGFIFLLIRIYQKVINPAIKAVTGPHTGCRFQPTCSNYFLQAVKKHGPYRGSWFGFCRILRCHPWGKFGDDPIPPKK